MSSVGIVRFTLIIFTTNDNVKTMKCDVLQFFFKYIQSKTHRFDFNAAYSCDV